MEGRYHELHRRAARYLAAATHQVGYQRQHKVNTACADERMGVKYIKLQHRTRYWANTVGPKMRLESNAILETPNMSEVLREEG